LEDKDMFRYSIIAVVAVLGISCSRPDSSKNLVELPAVSDTLYARAIALDDEIFKMDAMLSVCDKYIVMVDEMKTPYIRVIDIETETELYRWGEQGKGPGEFERITAYELLNNDDFNDCRVEIFSVWLGEVIVYTVTDSTLVEIDKFKVEYDDRRSAFNDIVYIKDGMYSILYDIDKKNKRYLAISKHSTDTLFSMGYYESIGEGIDLKSDQSSLVLSSNDWDSKVVTQDRELLFAYRGKRNKLIIYNTIDGSTVKSIDIVDDHFRVEENPNSEISYRHLALTGNENIYTIGTYITYESIQERGIENIDFYLEEWSREGIPLRRFLLDKPIGRAVIVQGDKLYTYSSANSEQYFMYQIPK